MKFTIGFEKSDVKRLYEYWDEIISAHKWTEGNLPIFLKRNGQRIINYMLLHSLAGARQLAALEFFNIKNKGSFMSFKHIYGNPIKCYKSRWQCGVC